MTASGARAQEWAERARRAAVELRAAFRRSDRFFKMRAGVFGAWVAMTVLTLFLACPRSGPANHLGANVQVLRESFVGGRQLLVRNESDDVWRDVVLTLDGEWTYQQRTLRPDEKIVISPTRFARGAERAPEDYRPQSLRVDCDQGSHTFDVR